MNVPGFLARIPGSDADEFRWFPCYAFRASVHCPATGLTWIPFNITFSTFSHKVAHSTKFVKCRKDSELRLESDRKLCNTGFLYLLLIYIYLQMPEPRSRCGEWKSVFCQLFYGKRKKDITLLRIILDEALISSPWQIHSFQCCNIFI
jgi:hypothetical protein